MSERTSVVWVAGPRRSEIEGPVEGNDGREAWKGGLHEEWGMGADETSAAALLQIQSNVMGAMELKLGLAAAGPED